MLIFFEVSLCFGPRNATCLATCEPQEWPDWPGARRVFVANQKGWPSKAELIFGAFCLDVRIFTFCQLMGFPLNHFIVKLLGEQKATDCNPIKSGQHERGTQLAARSHPFFGCEGSPTKIDYRKKLVPLFQYSNLCTGGPRHG